MRRCEGLPGMVRFLLCQTAIGFGLAALAMAFLLAADPNEARALLLRGAGHWWPGALLWLFLGLTFSAVQIGVALALLDGASPPPRRGPPVPAWLPGLVPARAKARRPGAKN
ncbi:hypothetical protein [Falsiroseomonas selenitidurans]|uniref:Uncharacterized protein n=1 Tax=Falsiroseomonas selenitidurans TaxID=2716335 RepID=A0ABX1E5F0_9PROT|nr:hypothetical protein [Falsiroseomonas selenitidurans]NKC32409.1 hypothetical protein [Falsiroseomonas selenitidurans]